MAKKNKKKVSPKAAVKTAKSKANRKTKTKKKTSSTDAIVVGLVNLVNKNVTAKEPALTIVKLIFYACGRLILEQEGSQAIHQQMKYIIED